VFFVVHVRLPPVVVPMTTVDALSWPWIALMAVGPPIAGVLVALPIWHIRQTILGNLAGTAVIFGSAMALIARESLALQVLTQGCLNSGYTCWPTPSAFARYAIYAFIALFEVFALFTFSLRVEQKIRRRGYAPEWR
jgi:hypothetical protein